MLLSKIPIGIRVFIRRRPTRSSSGDELDANSVLSTIPLISSEMEIEAFDEFQALEFDNASLCRAFNHRLRRLLLSSALREPFRDDRVLRLALW